MTAIEFVMECAGVIVCTLLVLAMVLLWHPSLGGEL